MASYLFRTVFAVAAPVAEVRRAVMVPEQWLAAWDRVQELRLLAAGDDAGVGRRYRTTVRAVAPYALTWEMEVVRAAPELVVWTADGDLRGNARWELRQLGDRAEVVSTWRVRTTPAWMNLLAPVARPVFVRNHDELMRRGARRLADHLGAELTAYEPRDAEPRRRRGRRPRRPPVRHR